MRMSTVFLLLILTVLMLTKCSDDPPVEPPPPPPNDTTSHEFTWEVDTLFYNGTATPAFLTARAMYGTSPTSMYLAGYSTEFDYMCWYWNGKKWEQFKPKQYWMSRNIQDFDGLDSTFLVFTGNNNGPSSQLAVIDHGVLSYINPPKNVRYSTCIHVVSRNEIYLGGVEGIQRYNGSEWEWLLDSTDAIGNEFQPKYIHKFTDGTLECVAFRVASGEIDRQYLMRAVDNQFSIIDSFYRNETDKNQMRFGHAITESEDGVYAIGSGGTYVWNQNDWIRIHDESGGIVGGTKNNLIMGQGFKYFWHYNGSTIKDLMPEIKQRVPNLRTFYTGCFIDGTLFIAGQLSAPQRIPIVVIGRQKAVTKHIYKQI